jgi:hypothetical protein
MQQVMKKSFIFVLFFFATLITSAQKTWFVGGTASIGYLNNFTFAFEPQFGYEFNDRFAIGSGVGLSLADDGYGTYVAGIAEPFVRFCAWHNEKIFIDLKATAGFGFTDELILCQVGIRPSLRFRINEHWDMSANLGLFGAQYTYSVGWRPAFGISASSAGLWVAYRF